MFEEIKVRYEIIFVNDCSPDDSENAILKIAQNDKNVIGINHSRNFSSQSAFLSGMEISTGDAIVLMDGDLQDPPELIPQFFEKWIDGYEVVYGKRIKREMSLFMNFIYKFFYRIFSKLSYIKIPNDAGDFSMIDRKVVNQLINLNTIPISILNCYPRQLLIQRYHRCSHLFHLVHLFNIHYFSQ